MKVTFDQSFYKRLIKIDDKPLLEKVGRIIIQAEKAEKIDQIANIKKLQGFKTYYRVRIGDYRIGLELQKDTLHFLIIAHRKDIYKSFP